MDNIHLIILQLHETTIVLFWLLIRAPAYYLIVVKNVGFGDRFWIQNRSTSQGLPYDFSSIMHVRHNAFQNDRFKSTIVPRNRATLKTELGSSATATDLDFLHINLLYCGGMDAKFSALHVVPMISHIYGYCQRLNLGS